MSTQEKPAQIRRFTEADRGQPYDGWQPLGGDYMLGMANTRGFASVHAVVMKAGAGGLKPIYDQPIIIENPGAVLICMSGDKIGLVRNFRFTAERLPIGFDYIRMLAQTDSWDALFNSLGRWSWEAPRGIAPPTDGSNLVQYIRQLAKIEAKDEAGFEIGDVRIAGRLNPNSTFFAHAQYAVTCKIMQVGEQRPEALEVIGQVSLFDRKQVREMIDKGEVDDSLTLAAMMVCGYFC